MTEPSGRLQPTLPVLAVVLGAVAVGAWVWLRHDTTGEQASKPSPEFVFDVERLREASSLPSPYVEKQPLATGLHDPRAVAVGPSGRIFVAGDSALRIFDAQGTALATHPLPGPPSCLAVAEDGLLFVGIRDHVEVYGANGKHQASWESPSPRAVVTSLAALEHAVFVADAGERIVWRYERSGKLLGRLGDRDPERNILGFVVPSPYFDLAIAADGLLRVVNPGRHRIEAYTFEGALERSWGKAGAGVDEFTGCCNPSHIALLPDGGFVTSEKGLPRVKLYDSQGEMICVVAGPDRFQRNAVGLDLAVDADGRILVLDPTRKTVRIFVREEGG